MSERPALAANIGANNPDWGLVVAANLLEQLAPRTGRSGVLLSWLSTVGATCSALF